MKRQCSVGSYYELPIHKHNEDLSFLAPVLFAIWQIQRIVYIDIEMQKKVMPVPDCKKGLPYKFNTYDEVVTIIVTIIFEWNVDLS